MDDQTGERRPSSGSGAGEERANLLPRSDKADQSPEDMGQLRHEQLKLLRESHAALVAEGKLAEAKKVEDQIRAAEGLRDIGLDMRLILDWWRDHPEGLAGSD